MRNVLQLDSLPTNDTTAVAQLLHGAELYEPAAVDFSFETIGWWGLGLLLLLVTLILGYFGLRRYWKNKYRREALDRIKRVAEEEQLTTEVFVVLKNTAIKAFGRRRVGGLYDHDWLAFLEKTGKQVNFLDREEELLTALYRNVLLSNEGKRKLMVNAEKWVKTHARQL
ncbi:DUF4381 domain-containing protein [Echinicola marina]|uniref:DUF4381 domain-containing protein n=1 Tax=Echinicola marina TaxID=2859768 RepID=UPI001CF6A53C|nr:DUF4381 domain-containing protein [Echinicola marina]UCS92069.1 DUF4381 domain-containing protein [Echinicola marina]